jgi:hypothetical protein
MMNSKLHSDYIYDLSDKSKKTINTSSKKKTRLIVKRACEIITHDIAWNPFRALQALWKARLQMRLNERPWTQVLPLNQSQESSSIGGLHSTKFQRPRPSIRLELQTLARNSGRGFRNQSRVNTSPGNINGNQFVSYQHHYCKHDSRLRRQRG